MSLAAGSTLGRGPAARRRGGLRILFIDHAGVLGGAELSLLDLARHKRASAEVVLLADGPFREALVAAGVVVHVVPLGDRARRVGRAGAWGLGAVVAAAAAAARLVPLCAEAELVHCNSQKAFALGALAASLAGRPAVWHLRDVMSAEHFGRTQRRLAVALGNRLAAAVLANSQATAEAFAEAGGRTDLVRVVYNGIDPAPFLAAGAGTGGAEGTPATPAAALRAELGLGAGPLVGCFGRLAPWKGQHVFLEAMAALPGVAGLVVGDALFGEVEYAAGLRARAEALGLGGRVRFLGFRRDVAALMAACDAVAHTSVAPEPFGRTIAEGLLAGRPTVATDAGGAREIIRDGETGWLVPPGEAAALAACLGRVLEDRQAAAAVAQRGRRDALQRFSLERMLVDFDQAVVDVVAGWHRR